MQINKFGAIGAIALVSLSAIAWLNSIKYEEEKKVARSEAKVAEVGCSVYLYSLASAEGLERSVKENPNDARRKELARQARESADKDKKDCQKVQDYKDKYEK